jgi:hypothetical protein
VIADEEGACFKAVNVRQHLNHHDAESVAISFLADADVAKLDVAGGGAWLTM